MQKIGELMDNFWSMFPKGIQIGEHVYVRCFRSCVWITKSIFNVNKVNLNCVTTHWIMQVFLGA